MSLVSSAYGRTIRRQKAPPVTLDEQFRTGKVEAMSLLAAGLRQFETAGQGGPAAPSLDPADDQGCVHRWVQRSKNCPAPGVEKAPFSRTFGEIAQLVEHTTENRGVLGSIPSLAIRRFACSGDFSSGTGRSVLTLRRGRFWGRYLFG